MTMLVILAVADLPSIITALTGFVAALAALYSVVRNGRTVAVVAENIATANGRSLGTLAELAEGRRIRREVPPAERTVREAAYVSLLEQVEREGSYREVAEDKNLTDAGKSGQGPAAASSDAQAAG